MRHPPLDISEARRYHTDPAVRAAAHLLADELNQGRTTLRLIRIAITIVDAVRPKS